MVSPAGLRLEHTSFSRDVQQPRFSGSKLLSLLPERPTCLCCGSWGSFRVTDVRIGRLRGHTRVRSSEMSALSGCVPEASPQERGFQGFLMAHHRAKDLRWDHCGFRGWT